VFLARPAKSSKNSENCVIMMTAAGATGARILHTHFASLGAPDTVFEQEASHLGMLDKQMAS
jgi:hypothetical protein